MTNQELISAKLKEFEELPQTNLTTREFLEQALLEVASSVREEIASYLQTPFPDSDKAKEWSGYYFINKETVDKLLFKSPNAGETNCACRCHSTVYSFSNCEHCKESN